MSHYFGLLFFHDFQLCTERSWGQPGTEFSPAVPEMPAFMPGSHILTIREKMKLLLQLPAPGPCSFPLASFLPLFLWHTDPFPHPWVTGACLCRREVPEAHQGSAALSNWRGRAKTERICPRFPTVHLHGRPQVLPATQTAEPQNPSDCRKAFGRVRAFPKT